MLRCGCILWPEAAAGQDRNLHGPEIRISDDVVRYVHAAIHRYARYADRAVPTALVKGEGREAGGLDSRKPIDAVFDLLEQHGEAGIAVLVSGDSGIDVQTQHILLVETGIDTAQ